MSEEKKEEEKKFVDNNHSLKIVLIVVGGLFVLAGISSLVAMKQFHGERKIMRNNIETRSFEMMGRGRMGMRGIGVGDRISGDITAISGNNITVKAADGTSYTVMVSDTTSYHKNGAIAKQSDLANGNNILVFGQSNSQGGINATSVDIK